MSKEINDEYNKDIGKIVKELYELRRIEHMDTMSMNNKYEISSKIIKKVTKLLQEQQNYVLYRNMWDELHDRMVYYYDYLNKENMNLIKNKENKIPIFRETLHNDVVKWWLKCKKYKCLNGPLIHFDTHDDMGIPYSGKKLLNHNGKIDEKGIENGSCGLIYWPVTCMLLSKGIDHVIWAMPSWIYDNDASFVQTIVHDYKKDEFIYLRSDKEDKDNFRLSSAVKIIKDNNLDKLIEKKYNFSHYHQLDRLKMDHKKQWNKLSKIINSNNFILDIDLDYFVTNGSKSSKKSYKEYFDDIESTNRVHDMYGVRTPRNECDDDYNFEVIKDLNYEVKLIEKRVQYFLDGLELLKNNGITPCCINISDSTPSFFSGNLDRAVFTNHYTPKYFVPLLHKMLIIGFKKLYKNKI